MLGAAEARLAVARAKPAAAQAEPAKARTSVDQLSNQIREREQKQREQLHTDQVCTTIRARIPTPSWRNPFAARYEERRVCVPDENTIEFAVRTDMVVVALKANQAGARAGLTAAQAAVSAAEAVVAAEQKAVDALQR